MNPIRQGSMRLSDIKGKIQDRAFEILSKEIDVLRPAQEKSIKAGLLDGKNLLVCTPTASGKTLVAELAALSSILTGKGKALYIVPLKALAQEKYRDFSRRYKGLISIAISIGDFDSSDTHLADYDLIILTSEKLDSLIRHHTPWLSRVSVLVVDEIHGLHDVSRGPTLEILITILRKILPKVQIIALSATIGNAEELAGWLSAELVQDDWRPVRLDKGIYHQGSIEFYEG